LIFEFQTSLSCKTHIGFSGKNKEDFFVGAAGIDSDLLFHFGLFSGRKLPRRHIGTLFFTVGGE